MLPTLVSSLCVATLLAPTSGVAAPDLSAAIAAQQRLVETSPTAAAVNDLGNLMVLAGRFDEAERLYRRALSLEADNTRARFNLALLLQSRERHQEALDLYRAVLATEPDHAWAHYQIGTVLEDRDQSAAAVASYGRAFALDPQLYFADVNPQVVSNRLLTEAILEAARVRQRANLAPMQYAEPREITELLLSLPPTAVSEPRDADTAPDASTVEPQ